MKRYILIFITFIISLVAVKNVYATEDQGNKLLEGFLMETSPDRATMILDKIPEPDSNLIKHIYLDMEGADIGGVRIERITVEAIDVMLTSPDTWGTESADIVSILFSNARTVINEKDINDNLKSKEFGGEEHWNKLKLDFSPGRVYARGYYLADLKLFKLNILIEIDGTFKVVKGKEIWLDDYTLKVNRASVPEGLTDRAIAKIQPILDLKKFLFPVKLSRVTLNDKTAIIESVRVPRAFDGVYYHYDKEPESADITISNDLKSKQ